MKVLMHMCCAPCSVYPVQVMKEKGIEIEGLFFNPNIHPIEEFEKRKENVEKLADIEDFFVHYLTDFQEEKWQQIEASDQQRCKMCYEMRLKRTFEYGKEHGFDAVTTSLLASPYQKHELIANIGNEYSKLYDLPFYYEDFRVGYREGIKEAKELDIYCQRYCGCILSLKERINELKQEI
ncbi:MAG: epoxyqueuosine reductase QueH [Firmicutes bacterium]|nr:epoxyqueuosine reductase QueH [Bacillota bacterium]